MRSFSNATPLRPTTSDTNGRDIEYLCLVRAPRTGLTVRAIFRALAHIFKVEKSAFETDFQFDSTIQRTQ